MNPTVVAFFTCLLVLYAQGQPARPSSKCKCINGFMGRGGSRQLSKDEPVIHEPSVFCPRTEIIVRTTDNKEKCVNPESKLGQFILKKFGKKEAVSATTTTTTTTTTTAAAASDQTSTSSSSRFQTTSKL